jgi:hypothetical protein
MRQTALAELARLYPAGYLAFSYKGGKRVAEPVFRRGARGGWLSVIDGETHLFSEDGRLVSRGTQNGYAYRGSHPRPIPS